MDDIVGDGALDATTLEAAAKVADWYVKMWTDGNSDQRYNDGARNTAEHIAKAIRALTQEGGPPRPGKKTPDALKEKD